LSDVVLTEEDYEELIGLANLAVNNLRYYQCSKCNHYEVKGYICSHCGYDNSAEEQDDDE